MVIATFYTSVIGATLLYGLREIKMYTNARHSRMKSNPPAIITTMTPELTGLVALSRRIVCVVGSFEKLRSRGVVELKGDVTAIWLFGELNVTTVDIRADAVALLGAFTGKSVPYAAVPVNIGLAAVDVDIEIMSGVDSKSVPCAVVSVNIGLAAVDVDIEIMSGVDSRSVPCAVVPVNIELAATDVDIEIMSGVDSKSVPCAVVPVNIELAAVDVDIEILSGVCEPVVVVALNSYP